MEKDSALRGSQDLIKKHLKVDGADGGEDAGDSRGFRGFSGVGRKGNHGTVRRVPKKLGTDWDEIAVSSPFLHCRGKCIFIKIQFQFISMKHNLYAIMETLLNLCSEEV